MTINPNADSDKQDGKNPTNPFGGVVPDEKIPPINIVVDDYTHDPRTYADKQDKETDKKERLSKKRNRRWQNWGVIVNALMIGVFMWSVLYQGNYTKKALKRADTANANTRESNENYVKLTKADLRAYIVPKIKDLIPVSVGKSFNFGVTYVNCGKTPAVNVNYFADFFSCIKSEYVKIGYDAMISRLERHKDEGSVLGSGIEYTKEIFIKDGIPQKDYVSSTKDSCRTCVIMGVRYIDKFKESHNTMICFIFDPHVKKWTTIPRYTWSD